MIAHEYEELLGREARRGDQQRGDDQAADQRRGATAESGAVTASNSAFPSKPTLVTL